MKSITLKKNGQTIENEIKVQALKDTSSLKPRYLVTFFLHQKYQATIVVVYSICSIVRREELHFEQLGE